MPAATSGQTRSLSTFLRSLKQHDIETLIELCVSQVKEGSIKNSRPCAIATAELLLRVVAAERTKDVSVLIDRIRDVGRRLAAAQPREMAVGNIVRRVLGVVREVAESEHPDESTSRNGNATAAVDKTASSVAVQRPPLPSSTSHAGQGPHPSSLLNFLEHPLARSPSGTPPFTPSPNLKALSGTGKDGGAAKEKIDMKAEVIDGIKDLLEELSVVDSQIAESALDHIHSNEIVLTHTSSQTVQKFLMTAARKRKFTVVHAEAFPNDHEATHATTVNGGKKGTAGADSDEPDDRWKPLTSMGITVILIPDTAVFALMSRINKVILAPHTVLANGSLIAAAGASTICLAAQHHRVPVVVLSGVYKLSPVYPFDTQELIGYGDPSKVVAFEDDFLDKVAVTNPVYDWVDANLVDLYITNLGGCAPSFLYRIVADHYAVEDIDLGAKR